MKEKRTGKPGVMIYADLRYSITKLTDAQAGQLFRAILEYGLDGTPPLLSSKLEPLWPIVQARLDADNDRYYDVVNKRSYAAYVRWAKEKNRTPLSYEKWLEADGHLAAPEDTPTEKAPAAKLDPFYQDLATVPPAPIGF